MKIDHTHGLARFMIIINPETGKEIRHVKYVDPERGILGAYVATPCAPGRDNRMQLVHNGDIEYLNYTFLDMRDAATGVKYYPTREHKCAFDVVHKLTGVVLYESTCTDPAPERVLNPEAVADEVQATLLAPDLL